MSNRERAGKLEEPHNTSQTHTYTHAVTPTSCTYTHQTTKRAGTHVNPRSRAFMQTQSHANVHICICSFVLCGEETKLCPVGLVYTGFHARPFVPRCIPLSWINALPLSQCSEQAEAAKRGLLDLQSHKSIERW